MRQSFDLPELPPQIDLAKHIGVISTAHEAIARYDEAQKRLINPEIIVLPMASLEAQKSSSIEGTQATYSDFIKGEENPDVNTEKGKDIQEIGNYRRAIIDSKKLLEKRPLSENVIKDLNRILLNSVRGANRTPGEFRDYQVHIGRPGATLDEASYVPPSQLEIPRLFSNLVNYIQDDSQPDRLVQAAVMHYQFEAIHPFGDGNGRTGRIMIPVYLYEKKVTSEPNMYISEFINKYRRDYYDSLRGVSESGDWDTWIDFFLTALREQAKTLKTRFDAINRLYDRYIHMSSEFSSKYAPDFIDVMFKRQIFTVNDVVLMAGIPASSVYGLIDKFVSKGVIVEDGYSNSKRQFKFGELIGIVEGVSAG